MERIKEIINFLVTDGVMTEEEACLIDREYLKEWLDDNNYSNDVIVEKILETLEVIKNGIYY